MTQARRGQPGVQSIHALAAHAIALAGCIPMVPGAFFGQAMLGYMAVAADTSGESTAQIVASSQAFVRVLSIVGSIGAGLTIPQYLLKSRQF